ncbi:MAG: hypothetical protein ACRDHV_01600 [Actinomycetota bacterium]
MTRASSEAWLRAAASSSVSSPSVRSHSARNSGWEEVGDVEHVEPGQEAAGHVQVRATGQLVVVDEHVVQLVDLDLAHLGEEREPPDAVHARDVDGIDVRHREQMSRWSCPSPTGID